jgi:hypothetical protein
MASYESDVKKLQKMWDKGQDNTNNIQSLQQTQTIKEQQVISLPPIETVINNLNDLGGDYIDIKTLMTFPYQINGFNWQITYVLPESWIPNIRIDIGYNYQAGSGAFTNVVTYMNKVVGIVPVPNSNGLVQATWYVNLFLCAYNPQVVIPDFQAKLYFVLIDPSLAV